jgi:nucleoside-diphosphate-sugar epimerase
VRLAEWRDRFGAWGVEVDASPWDEAGLTARLAELSPRLIFALLGTTRARGKRAEREGVRTESYETVDYGLTALLLRAARRGAPRARFVYLSAIGVSEDARGAYYRARWMMERELRASGQPFTIARPSFIVGERDENRPGERAGSVFADAALGFVGKLGARQLRDRYRSITGPELGSALVRLALDPAAENGTFSAEALR